jgi:predicted ArsR family transcriptional regulator
MNESCQADLYETKVTLERLEVEVEQKSAQINLVKDDARKVEEELGSLRSQLEVIRSRIQRSLGADAKPDREARREKVLDLRFRQKLTMTAISRRLGVTTSTLSNDIHHLEKDGRCPVLLAGPDDEVSRRRNHVYRVWRWRSSRSASDVARYLQIPVDVVRQDLDWLGSAQYISDWQSESKPVANDTEKQVREVAASTAQLQIEVSRQLTSQKLSATRRISLRTCSANNHRHVADVDASGDGQTIPDQSGHSHQVSRFCILPALKHYHDFLRPQP